MSPKIGLFGKTPETGDFVMRGLAQPVRHALDLWVTRSLVPYPGPWPEGGVRGLLMLGPGLWLILAVPSADRVGRRFPLVCMTGGQGLSFEGAEAWCDAAFPLAEDAARGRLTVDETQAALAALPPLARDTDEGAPALWRAGGLPVTPDAGLAGLMAGGADRGDIPG